MTKRAFDLIVSSLGLLMTGPLLCVLAIIIKRTSPGPVFYRGRRAGLNGKPFHIFKFRTMVINADKIGGSSTSDVDPRITKIGRFLRKCKLDELPQLLNVWLGEMSLVGPRPQVVDYVARYTPEEQLVLRLRPGITDWASIWNSDEGAVLAGHPDPDKAYDELIHPTKMKLQLFYYYHHNLLVDLKIIASTLVRIVWKNWTPAELLAYPKAGQTASATPAQQGYETVTELPNAGATPEQMAMLHTRYGWAGEIGANQDVLEVACGSGIGLGYLAHRARRIVGGDYDPKIAEIARQQYQGRIEVSQMNAECLPFADASFDVVLLLEAIYYLPNAAAFIAEARRVLRPNGKLLICSANCERRDFNPSPFSTRYYAARELGDLLQKNGFAAQLFAGFPTEQHGWKDEVRQVVRTVAVKLHLIPKTMRWKALFKRIFFGKLQPLPSALGATIPAPQPLIPLAHNQSAPHFKVIYVVGTRHAQSQRAAA